MLVYFSNKHKTQRISDEAIDDCLATLKFIPDSFVTSKMLEKLDYDLHANVDILFQNGDFDKIKFIANQRYILAVDLNKISLDNDNNFEEDDPSTIIYVRCLAWRSKFEKRKAFGKAKN